MGATAILGVSVVAVPIHDGRVAAMGFGDDRCIETFEVVGADQPQRNLWINRHIEQSLMHLAFKNLFGPSPCPDRFPYSTYRTAQAGVLIHKLLPRGNDARGVAAELGHVDEFDLTCLSPQALSQPVGMAPHDSDHDRFARCEPVLDEWSEDGGVVVRITPHERLVSIALLRSWWCGLRHNGFLKQFFAVGVARGSRHWCGRISGLKCLLARSRRTLPKPPPGPKPLLRRDGPFVTRITGRWLIYCSPAKDLLALITMIAKNTWQIDDIGSVRGLRRRLVPGDPRGQGKPGLLPLASGREATNPNSRRSPSWRQPES